MDFNTIFANYYTLYRGESETPSSTDDEFTIGLRLANTAISRWANVDGVYWKELFSTLQSAATGTKTIATGDTTYTAPTDMREAGGYIKILDGNGDEKTRYPIIEPQEAQFKDANSTYAYFTGNPTSGFTLNLNPAPTSDLNGLSIDYVYYKKATEFTTGTSTTEMANPGFIVHHMLANRFRVSRNYGGYQTAQRDAEEALKNMQQDNMSGTWANPWSLADNSGSIWGL